MPLRHMNKVKTPRGIGYTVGRSPLEDEILVLFSRKDYSSDEWLKVSPYGGPCRFIMVDASEVEIIENTD